MLRDRTDTDPARAASATTTVAARLHAHVPGCGMSVARRIIVGLHRASGLGLVALTALAGCGSPAPTHPSPVCSYVLTSDSQSFSHDGGTGTLSVTTDAGCAWTVQGASDWVTLSSGASGTGPGTVTYAVLPNTDAAAREKTLRVATRSYTITQEGREPCAYSIAPEAQRFSDEGGPASVQVTTGSVCTWSAKSTVPWLTITAGESGRGSGTVTYKADPNNAADRRSGSLTVATRILTVNQDGEDTTQPANCQYSVTPVQFTPCMPAIRLAVSVATQPRCQWTAMASVPWLTLQTGSAGAGPGTIAINVPDNYDAPRDGVVMVRWPTPTAGQNIRVEQAGCLYAVSQASFTIAAAGGSASFDVIQQSLPNTCGGPLQDRCVWSAASSVSWVSIAGSMPRSGDNPVAFTVSANTGAARTGRIIVRDKVVTIAQSGP